MKPKGERGKTSARGAPPSDAGASGRPAGGTLAFVDAVEGKVARLLIGREAVSFPVRLLPPGAGEGRWLRVAVAVVPAPPDDTEARRRHLAADDPGGDIKL